MFNIKIIALGKLKETYWEEAEQEYLKRLKQYAKIEIIEIPEEPFRENDNREKIKEKEAFKIEKLLSNDARVIALHERGKEYTSVQFSEFLSENSSRGEEIVFVIGGPLGIHETLLKKTEQISLSCLTFPHQMVRTILLEQIYRSATIIHGKQYHY